eukprot:2882460-Ditylum_brightwellii.AAC.1
MAPTTQGVYSACKIAADNIDPNIIESLGAWYWWGRWWGKHGIDDGAKRVSTCAPTKGTNYCPLKLRQWIQRAEAYPFKQKEDAMCVLAWG